MANLRPLFLSKKIHWATPKKIYDELNSEFNFNFDPCPLNSDEDGLSELFCSWKGKRVYCNPPYGPKIVKWLQRGKEAELAVYLLPARTDTKWFHEIVLPNAKEIRFIKGRLKFGDSKNGAPFPSMIIIFDNKDK